MVPKVPYVTLGTMALGILSFDFKRQNVGMYKKYLTSGHIHGLKYIVTIAHQLTGGKMQLYWF